MIRRRNAAIEREKRLYKMNYWGVGRGMGERRERRGREGEGLHWICNSNMCQVTFRICHTRQDTASSAISALWTDK